MQSRRRGIDLSNFDYFNFSDGSLDVEFVAHANKYTKEEVVELCIQENDFMFEGKSWYNKNPLREPTINDIRKRSVRWYPRVPGFCDYDGGGGGCYTYCKKGEHGSFPVWVIEFEKLKITGGNNE